MVVYGHLEGSKKVDVAIVGGGIAGVASAYELSKSGRSVVLVEQELVGGKSSSRAVGMTIGETFEVGELSTIIGYDAAMEDFLTNYETHQRLGELSANLGVRSYTKSGAVAVILDSEKDELMDEAKMDVELRKKYGLPRLTMLTPEEVRNYVNMPDAAAGLHYNGDEAGKISPAELLERLAEAATRNGAALHEGTKAAGMRRRGNRVIVTTDSGEIDAKYAIIATQGIRFDGTFSPFVRPIYTHVVATEPLDEKTRNALRLPNCENIWVFTDDPAYAYFTTTPDNRVIGGCGEDVIARGRRPHPERTSLERYKRMYRRLQDLLPDLRSVRMDYGWNDYIGMSPDHLPIIEFDRNVYTIHALTDSGIVKGLTIARLMPQELDGKRPEYFRFCDAGRFK